MVLTLELWKKNGNLKEKEDNKKLGLEKNKAIGSYDVFGYFDSLRLSRKKGYSDILGKYSKWDLNPHIPYNHYSLPLFSIDGLLPNGDAPLCKLCDPSIKAKKEELNDSYIYQLTAIKLNPEIINGYDSGMSLFNHIGKEIETCLKENLDSFINNISYAIVGGLGSFDFLLICGINKSDIMIEKSITVKSIEYSNQDDKYISMVKEEKYHLNIWHAIQRISAVLRRRRDIDKNFHAYFDYSSTFYTCFSGIDYNNCKSPICYAKIELTSLHCRKSCNVIEDELNDCIKNSGFTDIGKNKEFTVFHMQGDEDHHISFKGALFHLLYTFNSDKAININQDNYIREFHTYFLNYKHPINSDDTCVKHDFPFIDLKLKHLLIQYNNIKKYIPSLIINTVENMLFTCKYMLYSDYYTLTGIRMQSLLSDLFLRIEEYNDDLDQICKSIQDISYMLPVNLQHHAIHFYDFNGVDRISPISKLIYAYEHFITSIQSKMCQEINKVKIPFKPINIFLTLGHTEQIQTTSYFDDNYLENSTKSHLVGFNLPSVCALTLRNSYAFLIHEAAHYGLFSNSYKSRNDSYYKIFIYQIYKQIVGKNINNTTFEKDKQIFDYIENYFDCKKNQISDLDYEKLRLHTFYNKLKSIKIEMRNQILFDIDRNKLIFDRIKLTKIDSIPWDNILEALKEIMLEIYADVFMFEICEFTFEEFANHYYKYFNNNGIDPTDDNSWTLRIGTIYFYSRLVSLFRTGRARQDNLHLFSKIEEHELEHQNEEWRGLYSGEQYLFYEQIYKGLRDFSKQLYSIASTIVIESNLFPIRKNLDKQEYPNKSIMEADVDTQTRFFINHWYEEVKLRTKELLRNS